MAPKQFILCTCAFYKHISADKVEEADRLFNQYGVTPLVVDDLCKAAVAGKNSNPVLTDLLNTDAETVVLGCYPRAVRSLLKKAGLETVEVINLRSEETAALEVYLKEETISVDGQKNTPGADGWVPWFPVIDYDRCTGCKQCLNFCLFGVYSESAGGTVDVCSPEKCKTNCPACARICPEVAIIFPKYKQSPINGGPIVDEELERARVEASKRELLGSDVYKGLKMRQEKRKRMLIRRQELENAYKEREKYTKESEKKDHNNK